MEDPDILEMILKRLNVKDLIRCKSVCKSWNDLISDSHFIKIHMNHSYHIDCNNNGVDRRIVMQIIPYRPGFRHYRFDDELFPYHDCHPLASCNGLVCISQIPLRIVVANPSTREVKKTKHPQIPDDSRSLCWGFGYDSSTDDYKVILGFTKGNGLTGFQVLSLKLNAWKVMGDVNYSIVSGIGILCNGALHWVMKDPSSQSEKNAILSFHLSKEEFKEIPQPDDAGYESDISRLSTMRLGIIEGCLCVFNYETVTDNLWMMKNYNVKESWGMVGKDCEMNLFNVHRLKELKHYIPHKRSLIHNMWISRHRDFIGAAIFVESLVSPHVNGKPKKKRQASDKMKSCKFIKGDPSIPGSSGEV